jgi:hypothetical protein
VRRLLPVDRVDVEVRHFQEVYEDLFQHDYVTAGHHKRSAVWLCPSPGLDASLEKPTQQRREVEQDGLPLGRHADLSLVLAPQKQVQKDALRIPP